VNRTLDNINLFVDLEIIVKPQNPNPPFFPISLPHLTREPQIPETLTTSQMRRREGGRERELEQSRWMAGDATVWSSMIRPDGVAVEVSQVAVKVQGPNRKHRSNQDLKP